MGKSGNTLVQDKLKFLKDIVLKLIIYLKWKFFLDYLNDMFFNVFLLSFE